MRTVSGSRVEHASGDRTSVVRRRTLARARASRFACDVRNVATAGKSGGAGQGPLLRDTRSERGLAPNVSGCPSQLSRSGGFVSEAVCKPSSVPRFRAGMAIHLDRRLPDGSCGRPEGWAAHLSPSVALQRRRVAPSYVALLQVEFAAFHPAGRSRRIRLCGTVPRLAADGRYPLPCAGELGLSSSRADEPTRRATIRPPH